MITTEGETKDIGGRVVEGMERGRAEGWVEGGILVEVVCFF